jgi:CheY-like chemotaxis protein
VEVDPGQISQVIHHLALNADQAMPAGGNLRILAENIELLADDPDLGLRAGRWVRLCLKDEGIGIPAEYRQRIFDPYFTTKPKGAGLGLATTHRILKNHSTVIVVESEPGMGSAFTTYLPASERELPVAAPTAAPASESPARVLVLDDEEAICMIIQCALEDLGHHVTVTHDGKDAIAAYEKALKENRRFDLVVSDLSIPGGMGGKDTIKRLCEIDPEVRAIVSSGYAIDPVMSRYEEFGFTGMIAKPYTIDAMCRKVTEVLATPRQARVV